MTTTNKICEMKNLVLAALFCLLSGSVFAQGMGGPGQSNYLAANGILPVANGGTGATSLGACLSNSGSTLNTTQPAARNVLITTDTITSSDACGTIVYNNASAIAASISAASTAGLTQGFGFVANNIGAGTVTITPTTSTINGASSFAIPQNTGCYVYSDGTNYQIDFASCSALPIANGNLPANLKYRVVGLTIDGGGTVLTTGQKGYYRVPFSGTITGYSLVSDISGSTVIDVWKSNNAVPTVANTITASALPTLSSSQYLNSTTLTGWTTSVAAGDVFGFNINSASTLTRVTLELYVTTN